MAGSAEPPLKWPPLKLVWTSTATVSSAVYFEGFQRPKTEVLGPKYYAYHALWDRYMNFRQSCG